MRAPGRLSGALKACGGIVCPFCFALVAAAALNSAGLRSAVGASLRAACGSPEPPRGAAGTRARPSRALDPRLAQRAKDSQVGASLGEYARLLTKSTGVEQSVKPSFDVRPLLALNVDLSLEKLQRVIEANYQLTWFASTDQPPRYILEESAADGRARAQALTMERRRARLRMLARLDDVRRLASLSNEELAPLEAAGEGMAQSLKYPRSRAMAQLLLGLPQPLVEEFWRTGSVRIAVGSLPGPLQELARGAAGSRIDPADVERGSLAMKLGGSIDRPTIWANQSYGQAGHGYNLLYNEGIYPQPPQERRRGAEALPSSVPTDPRFKKKVSLNDPGNRPAIPVELGQRPPDCKPLAILLQDLGWQVDMPILAECEYRRKGEGPDPEWLRRQWWLPDDILDEPLPHVLDLLCADFEYEWRFKGGALLFRPRLWFAEPEQRRSVVPRFP
jgi:hypothetical protein